MTEYYNPALDHYFISDLAPDIEALDTARIPGWMRTGQSFGVFAAPAPALNPVCRFYIPPEHGNSHFFSASPAECATVQARTTTDANYSGYVYESPNAFFVALPDTTTGACAPQWIPVFRLWNQRADSNHRYTADPTVKAQMLAKSYVPEGYGPSATIMCAARRGMASVRFVQGSGEPNGALVSDGVSTAAAAYQGYATAGSSVIVGPRVGTGEVIAFSSRRAVTLQPAAWDTQAGDQTIDATLAGEIALPLTVWIVAGPYATAQQTALTLWSTAQQIFRDERLGITLPVEFVDATAHPKAASWTAFTCGGGNANVAALQSDIGARAGRINVYIVPLVDGSTSRGNACALGGRFAAIAAGATADLLAHEVGHDLALEHINDLAAFNAANVMHSSSSTRMYLTEGQLFRAYLRSSSAMNALNLRPGQPVRDCDRDTLAIGCPAVHKRVWADGPLPPN